MLRIPCASSVRAVNPFRHLLDELNEILDRAPAEDADGPDDGLQQLRADVVDRLAEERPADQDPERDATLADTLQDAEDRYQAEHPRLVQAIQQALVSLADAGF